MANWDKINKKLDEVLDNLTQEDWLNWDKQKEANSIERRKCLINQGQIQEKEILIDFSPNQLDWDREICLLDDDLVKSYFQESIQDNPSNISRGYLFLVSSQYGTRNKCCI